MLEKPDEHLMVRFLDWLFLISILCISICLASCTNGSVSIASLTPDIKRVFKVYSSGDIDLIAGGRVDLCSSGGKEPYSYKIISGAGSIDSNGVFTAGDVAGTSQVRVSDSDGEAEEFTLSWAGTLPSSIAGLRMWLKADAISGLNQGDAVANWPDSSNQNNFASQGDPSKQPTYVKNRFNNYSAVRFDSLNDGMITSLNLSNAPLTVFVVYSFNSTSSVSRRALQGSNNWLIGPYTGNYSYFAGSFAVATPVQAFKRVVHTVVQGVATGSTYVDSANMATIVPATAPGIIGLGSEGAFSEPLDGDIAEVIVYDVELSNAERLAIESYLLTKYQDAVEEPAVLFKNTDKNTEFRFDTGRARPPLVHTLKQGSGSLDNCGAYNPQGSEELAIVEQADTLGVVRSLALNTKISLVDTQPIFNLSPAVWLNSNTISSNGSQDDPVAVWKDFLLRDRSAIMMSPGRQPLLQKAEVNGNDALSFDSIDDGMQLNFTTASTDLTVAIVYNYKSAAPVARRAIQGSSNWLLGPYLGSYSYFSTSFTATPLATIQDQFVIQVGVQTSGLSKNYVNGTLTGSLGNAGVPGTFGLGNVGFADERLNGDIAEVIIIENDLSDTEREELECYLSNKFNISVLQVCP